MRVRAITALMASVLVLAGWTARGDVTAPRNCTAVETHQRAVLTTEDPTDGRGSTGRLPLLWSRPCRRPRPRHVIRNRRRLLRAPLLADSVGLFRPDGEWEPTRREGSLSAFIQQTRTAVPTSLIRSFRLEDLPAPRGTAVQSNGLRAGTFSGVWEGNTRKRELGLRARVLRRRTREEAEWLTAKPRHDAASLVPLFPPERARVVPRPDVQRVSG